MPPISNPRNANGGARRRVRATVLAEEHDCAICGQPVDKTLTMTWGQHSRRCTDPGCPGCVPHPWRGEVDEIIPIAQGGSPTDRANCRLAHRLCNQRRGDATHTPRAEVHRADYPTTRAW